MVQPHVPPTNTRTTRGNPTPTPHRLSPGRTGFRKHGRAFLSDNQRPKVRPKSRTRTRLRFLDVARSLGTGDGFIMDRRSPIFPNAGTPTGIRRFDAYVYVRTSQDCGSSTAPSLANIRGF